MALQKTAVFLASRFDEFADLRKHLRERIEAIKYRQIEPIDLNDERVGHRPPLDECRSAVRRSEFMILLVGETYGSTAPGEKYSFTELEYREAMETENCRILPFFIGASYADRTIDFSSDPVFAKWQKDLQDNHTVGFLDPNLPDEGLADEIFRWLDKAHWEFHEQSDSQIHGDDEDEWDDSIDGAVSGINEQDIDQFDQYSDTIDINLTNDAVNQMGVESLLKCQISLQALEHREEGRKAMELGFTGEAIHHFQSAIEILPLDVESHYYLAKVYVGSYRKKHFQSAIEHADKAARLYRAEGKRGRAATAHILAARAASGLGRHTEGLDHAKTATEVANNLGKSHVELARQYAIQSNVSDAMRCIRTAIRVFPPSLKQIISDPDFNPIRSEINDFLSREKAGLVKNIQKLEQIQANIDPALATDPWYYDGVQPEIQKKMSFPKLADLARKKAIDTQSRIREFGLTWNRGRESTQERAYEHFPAWKEAEERKIENTRALARKSRAAQIKNTLLLVFFVFSLIAITAYLGLMHWNDQLGLEILMYGAGLAAICLFGFIKSGLSIRSLGKQRLRYFESLDQLEQNIREESLDIDNRLASLEKQEQHFRGLTKKFEDLLNQFHPAASPYRTLKARRPRGLVRVKSPIDPDQLAEESGKDIYFEPIKDELGVLDNGAQTQLFRIKANDRDGMILCRASAWL